MVGDQAAHFAVLDDDVPDILARTDGHAALTERFAHAVDMIRQAIAPQMLLTDEQQIDAVFFGFLADGFGILHVRGKYRGRHAETVKNGLRLFDKAFRFGAGHELGEIGLAELVDEVQLAVREQPPPPIPERIWQGSHFMHFLALPSGQPRFLTMLPRSTMHTDKSEWSASHKPRTARQGRRPR